MPLKRSFLAGLLLGLGLGAFARGVARSEAEKPCREHPQLIGSCFTVHGRMSYWNGNPTVRIWKIGTKRILGVSDGRFKVTGYSNLPVEIGRKLSWENDLVGDFVVCPFTPDVPGVMRLVCVDSVKHLLVRPRRSE